MVSEVNKRRLTLLEAQAKARKTMSSVEATDQTARFKALFAKLRQWEHEGNHDGTPIASRWTWMRPSPELLATLDADELTMLQAMIEIGNSY